LLPAFLPVSPKMFEPVRGGTRGGQAEFKWSDVSADKDRENYLGHSINAPTGRWQKNKDVHWYNRDVSADDAARAEEIRKVKEAEAEALSAALGFAPAPKASPDMPVSGANAIASIPKVDSAEDSRAREKEEKRRRKAERKEEKRAKKEARRAERVTHGYHSDDADHRRRRDHSRSRSPRPHRSREPDQDRYPYPRRPRSRSRTPSARDRYTSSHRISDYDAIEREKERESDRHRWAISSRRDEPGGGPRRGRE